MDRIDKTMAKVLVSLALVMAVGIYVVQTQVGKTLAEFDRSEATQYKLFLESCLTDNKLYQCQAQWKATAWYR